MDKSRMAVHGDVNRANVAGLLMLNIVGEIGQ